MCDRFVSSSWRPLAASLAALLMFAGPAWGQEKSSPLSGKDNEPVVRTYGAAGDYRTEVTSQTTGRLTKEDQRQASLLAAMVFQHIDKASDALDADDTKEALKEINKGREAIKAIRTMLPKTTVRTKTTAPDGKAIYEDDREVQDTRIPLYEGMLHAKTVAPILAARKNALGVAGYQVVESEMIATETIADLDSIDAQLARAAKALENNKPENASKALAMAFVRGIDIRFSKEDSELASARDAIALARHSLEENNTAQALVNLATARARLRVYREVLSQDDRAEVDQMLREVDQLEAQLRQERNQPASRADRSRQGGVLSSWFDKINSWFKRR
jgi:YfdX protein